MGVVDKYHTQHGFTIAELIIVIVVIGILATVSIVGYGSWRTAATKSEIQSNLNGVVAAMESARSFNNSYPTTVPSTFTPNSGVVLSGGAPVGGESFCVSGQKGGVAYRITNDGTEAKEGTCAYSCFGIQSSGASTGNGVYTINPDGTSMQAYCDMTTSGGGWTLIVTNPGPYTVWNLSTVYSLNSGSPSISAPYSILNRANSIKSDFNGNLQYRIDGVAFGSWGGVWQAPYSNSFVGTTAVNNGTNIEKYSSWTIDTTLNDTTSLTNVMPWVGNTTQLLTTWGGAGSWWGTLVTGSSGWVPAPFITPERTGPGIIWYWVK